MKTVFNNRECAHIWAQQRQPEGRGFGNIFFEGDKIYSYGKHFCIGRIVEGVAILTTRSYGNATSKHINYTRVAVSHMKKVYCNDPSESAATNRRVAIELRNEELDEAATTRRIKQATRDKHRAGAYQICVNFNAYLDALPVEERVGVDYIPTDDLADVEFLLAAMEREKQQKVEEQAKQRAIPAAERLARWREFDPKVYTDGFHVLPVALRLRKNKDEGERRMVHSISMIETSHGASVPVSVASDLWELIKAAKTGKVEDRVQRRLGNYMLNQIKEDGTIVVGCHTIPYSELELMAKQLKFI